MESSSFAPPKLSMDDFPMLEAEKTFTYDGENYNKV